MALMKNDGFALAPQVAGGYSSLTPEGKATLKNAAVGAGMKPEAFDVAVNAARPTVTFDGNLAVTSEEKIADFNLNYGPHAQVVEIDKLAAFDHGAKVAFGSVGLDQRTSQICLDAFLDAAGQWSKFADADEDVQQTERLAIGAQVKRLSNFSEILRLSEIGQAALKKANPAWHDDLYQNGAFWSVRGVEALARIGADVERRKR